VPANTDKAPESIRLYGVRQNNLKGFDLELPLGRYIAVTGLSGSGKSSLVFETLHAEGQRRYVETFSAYTRQFLDLLPRPRVDRIENIRPSIAIEQSNTVKTSRSTVGTMTELCDFFKVWFPHVARLFDPDTGREITDDNPQTIWRQALKSFRGQTVLVAFEVARPDGLEWADMLENIRAQGYSRAALAHAGVVRLDALDAAELIRAEEAARSANRAPLAVVQDRVRLELDARARFLEAAETALHFGQGRLVLLAPDGGLLARFSRGLHSPDTGRTFRSPTPALFSFNSPIGACPRCRGFGRVIQIDDRLVIPDTSKSIEEGAIKAFEGQVYSESKRDLIRAARRHGIPADVPVSELTPEQWTFVKFGEPRYREGKARGEQFDYEDDIWYGLKGFFDWLESNTYKMHVRVFLSRFRAYVTCPECGGARLIPEALCWKWEGHTLPDLYALPVSDLLRLLEQRAGSGRRKRAGATPHPAEVALDSILTRLRYLVEVGLGYLTLDRASRTLSGGEVERVNLTACLGTSLVDTLFVLDEPSVGLHARDIDRLIRIIRSLTDAGNTVVVVEHDEAMIRAADHVIEMGPRPGREGGEVVFQGTLEAMLRDGNSLTGKYLSGRIRFPLPETRRPVASRPSIFPALHIRGATLHNLRGLDVDIPLQRFVCLSGVSGSGKSTLLDNVIHQGLLAARGLAVEASAELRSIESDLEFTEIVLVDQAPVSRTPRSNPALYTDAWNDIRALFAATPEAAARGYTPSTFSFNAGDGRCPHCQGLGYERVEMQFLSDVFIPCPVCEGRRFRDEVLAVRWRDITIADVLELTVERALAVFGEKRRIVKKLQGLADVGLGYLTLGQPLNTLSGGESQRLKLIKYLARAGTAETPGDDTLVPLESAQPAGALLLLDEPTTGLHRDDVRRLVGVLQALVDRGHSLVIIEHNLDVLASADWIIELGPGAGADGGRIVASGTPETIAASATETAPYLKAALEEAQSITGRRGSGRSARFRSAASKPRAVAEQQDGYGRGPASGTDANHLCVIGAREHNLRNITVDFPHRKLSVVTGVSGSGKSTLAFDIVFAEGQRRFMESMSPYARQFVEQLPRPQLDRITGIPPTVAIEQRVTRGSRKSTVATITEVAQYLRLLFARVGVQHNPDTGKPVLPLDEGALFDLLRRRLRRRDALSARSLLLLAPLVRGRKGHHQPLANWALEHGYERLRVDGRVILTENFKKLDRYREHDIEAVVADVRPLRNRPEALREKLTEALRLGNGACFLLADEAKQLGWFSTTRTDAETGESFPELDPKHFSFNSPRGWCPTCRGHGRLYAWMLQKPADDMPEELFDLIHSMDEEEIDALSGTVCPDCQGARLNRVARSVKVKVRRVGWLSLPELLASTPDRLILLLRQLDLDERGRLIAADIVPQVEERLKFMDRVGLGYLTLDRATETLSGGEAQRIRLAAQLGTNLAGVLYVLDEPTIGLHARDNERLIDTLVQLRDKGNTLLVVEHDDAMMARADRIIDLGPGAGVNGGRLLASGTIDEIRRNAESITGRYLTTQIPHPLNGRRRPLPPRPKAGKTSSDWLELRGVSFRNLRNLHLRLPLGRLVMVSGVSGAGKSTLVRDILRPAVAQAVRARTARLTGRQFVRAARGNSWEAPPFEYLINGHRFRSVIEVDQSPIGKTPRSTPATYLGAFDLIREFFASLPESKIRGYKPGRFSFNTAGGRCEACKGAGRIKFEMSFMPETYTVCERCGGRRYSPELEEIRWKGKNIADVLEMSFEEAAGFFDFHARLAETMQLMVDTGLGYLTLGQSSPTLSGGEAQRLKLVTELARGLQTFKERSRGTQPRNLYILEEPTVGLHLSDCEKLIHLLHRLVDQGHTVIVIEHHLDLLAEADYIVDLGPEGGPGGGRILYQGSIAGLIKSRRSLTAPFLRDRVQARA